jgi:AraC family transcriptional regulator
MMALWRVLAAGIARARKQSASAGVYTSMGLMLERGVFYGRVFERRQVGGLVLTETIYPPRASVPKHCHSTAYVCFVRRGGYEEQYGARRRTCGPQTVALHPGGEVHAERFGDAEVRSFNVELLPDWASHLPPSVLNVQSDSAGGAPADLAARLYREFRHKDDASSLVIEGLALELIGEMARAGRSQAGSWLEGVRELVDARSRERLSQAEQGALAGVHPVYQAAAFRRRFGMSVGEYARRKRVERAAATLARSDTPLAAIAVEAGFSDQAHFTRVFKRHTGMTPRAYHRLHFVPGPFARAIPARAGSA